MSFVEADIRKLKQGLGNFCSFETKESSHHTKCDALQLFKHFQSEINLPSMFYAFHHFLPYSLLPGATSLLFQSKRGTWRRNHKRRGVSVTSDGPHPLLCAVNQTLATRARSGGLMEVPFLVSLALFPTCPASSNSLNST